MAGNEVTIGEFARRSGLSLKALRLYDARGLLEPVRVDPASGYRYYDPEQLSRARTISLLRRLEMPLGTIADVLAEPPGQAAAIRSWWQERRRDLADRGPEVDLVLGSLGTPGSVGHPGHFGVDDVVVQPVEARTVATVRRHVTQEDLVATFASDALEIRTFLDTGGASYGTEFWVLFHGAVGHDGDGPIETCIPYEGAVAPAGSVVLRQEPAHTLAYVPVTAADCRYPQIIGAYVALETWFSAGGRRPAGPPREIYPVPWSDEGVVAHVAQPVA
ncbi:MerR family transcriptional regulator [Cellulomonas humilata]|uniref:DNA-binding transcriptional MerR regulator n=1 Tax=Cellulomonas humilata TaxID=144055 RepID=A0ABU0EA30_9CELL|nr:helix-turn-helix domain-containing protein [Cellulomonas humilata]MDQ0371935.1 DNA-binding transcriptional MerR regulator [Cellulomonas humilata]